MRLKKTPREKKRLSLERDHPIQAKYPHEFRKSWPLKEKKAQRGFRHKVKQTLTEALGTIDPITINDVDVDGIRRKIVRKWPVKPLEDILESKKDRRIFSYRRKKDARLRTKHDA